MTVWMRPRVRPQPFARSSKLAVPGLDAHPGRVRRALVLLPALAIASAACATATGSAATTAQAPTPPPATASAEPVPSSAPSGAVAPTFLLEVATEGGFINPAASIGAIPRLVVESDGRILTPAVDAQPVLAPAITVRDVGPAGASAIVDAIKAAGLDAEASGGIAADTGSTVFTVNLDGTEVVSRFATGGMGGVGGPGGPGGPGGHEPGASDAPGTPGAAAFELLARLTDPTVAWAGTTGSPATFAPAGYRIWVAPAADAGPSSVPWPLAGDPSAFGGPAAASFGVDGLRSGVVRGTDVAAIAPLLAAAPGTTATAAGRSWQVWVRPLLPDELGA
jgi:hypothetical protein